LEQVDHRQLAVQEIDAVYRLAYYLCDKSQEAEDAVQETYLRAFNARSNFKLTEYGVRPWLFKILHNVIRARAIKQHRQPSLMGDLDEAVGADGPADEQPLTDVGKIDWDSVDERLKNAIGDLPVSHRTVFLLCAVENLKYREIADIVALPLGTVTTQIYRARATLAARLASLAAEQGIIPSNKIHSQEIDPPRQ